MSLVQSRYDLLVPCLEDLADEVVLTQAWKKAERYIRWTNSYADVLALDLAMFSMESDLGDWARAVRDPGFQPDPMDLVPAPKNWVWEFPSTDGDSPISKPGDSDWRPRVSPPPLRPLAHLSIRDQTLAMGLVLCFADAVETLQGPTDQPDAVTARGCGIYSYGNRLWCDWRTTDGPLPRARFRWSSAATYSAFFEDYRRFLARPGEIGRWANARLGPGRAIYVVELDLRRFFDRMESERLLFRLGAIWRLYARLFGLRDRASLADDFIAAARRIMSWHWSDHAKRQALVFVDPAAGDPTPVEPASGTFPPLPAGLPQGLVASGFLSNAYMLRFDHWMGRRLGREGKLVLHDYCRYVDDIRLVVEVDRGTDPETVARTVTGDIQALLQRYCSGLGDGFQLAVNEGKTQVVPWSDYAVQGSASAQMSWLQGLISATPDQDSLRQATAALDGLLWLSEAMESAGKEPRNPLILARIALPKLDVRDDTLKRFVAYRHLASFRLRLSMASEAPGNDPDSRSTDERESRPVLEHEMEATARKLIASWSRNPALVPVLRCGLALFPSPTLLAPVLQALAVKRLSESGAERAIADYVTAELLRAGAVEIGHRDAELIPRITDLAAFRERLASVARAVLDEKPAAAWFLRQQAALYLASLLQPEPDLAADAPLIAYKQLHDALLFRRPNRKDAARAVFAGLVGQQFGASRARFATWVDDLLERQPAEERRQLATALGHMRPDLLQDAWQAHADKRSGWTRSLPPHLHPKAYAPGTWDDWGSLGSAPVPLARVVRHRDNPFREENAALGLIAALLETMTRPEYLEARAAWGLLDLAVACNRWHDPQHPDAIFEITVIDKAPEDPRNQPPGWCRQDLAWAYALGRILRACLVGDPDFTTRGCSSQPEHARYRGLSSSWLKRRLGLLNTPEGLLGEPVPLSLWLVDLIMMLLQWPGLQPSYSALTDLARVETPQQLALVIAARRQAQRDIYGFQSGLPLYVQSASRSRSRTRQEAAHGLRVAMVQTLLPRADDFDSKDPLYWPADYRARHRAHLAAVCRLVAQHLATEHSAAVPTRDLGRRADVDLILFPELAVHPDDLWLLRSLSDTTRANLFAGLTFQEGHRGRPVNRALWLLRHERDGNREIIRVQQGKRYITKIERRMGVEGECPYLVLIELTDTTGARYRLVGTICYDATDLSLAADLRDRSDCLVIAALNKDVPTFDAMVQALNYHMFQPVIMTNSGEFGGSTAQAPYRERHEKVIAYIHGSGQVAISVFELDLAAFRASPHAGQSKALKTRPAGCRGWPG
ncbi:MAG: RNA-directed DNA polymerase [Chromatiaceae bacterium]|nr:MAG: RNA-directed DNA polymerase [Chromatiaceae bacterium]